MRKGTVRGFNAIKTYPFLGFLLFGGRLEAAFLTAADFGRISIIQDDNRSFLSNGKDFPSHLGSVIESMQHVYCDRLSSSEGDFLENTPIVGLFTLSRRELTRISSGLIIQIRNLRIRDGVKSDLKVALPSAPITLTIVHAHFNLAV